MSRKPPRPIISLPGVLEECDEGRKMKLSDLSTMSRMGKSPADEPLGPVALVRENRRHTENGRRQGEWTSPERIERHHILSTYVVVEWTSSQRAAAQWLAGD